MINFRSKINKVKMKFMVSNHRNQSAFTLIEILVSVALFLVVMTIVLGAVLAIVDGNKKTQAINSVSNNLSSAIESMIRDIKTGYQYKCGVTNGSPLSGSEIASGTGCDATTGIQSITFKSTISGAPRVVQYWLSAPDPTTGRKYIAKYFCPANVADCSTTANYQQVIITSPDIDVKDMNFYVKVPAPSTDQPGVFVLIKGTAYVNKTQTSDFSIQSFVSQRILNI